MTAAPIRILVVDDEPPIRRLLKAGLATQGYDIVEAGDGATARQIMLAKDVDLVILDLGLPDVSGLDLLREWQSAAIAIPVIVLSSRTDEAGIVQALEHGADDYVPKPFGMNELMARIRVAFRHRLQIQGEKPVFRTGDLSVDLVRRMVSLKGQDVKLSPKEYDILRVLVQHAGKVLTHRFLMQEVWGAAYDVQYLRVYVRQLRQKLGDNPEEPFYIRTETGVGYRFREALV